MKYLFLFLALVIISCKPEKELPGAGMKVYKHILNFIDAGSKPPPAVTKFVKTVHDSIKQLRK